MIGNLVVHNVDFDLLNEQYIGLLDALDTGHISWPLVELIGNVLQEKGYHIAD